MPYQCSNLLTYFHCFFELRSMYAATTIDVDDDNVQVMMVNDKHTAAGMLLDIVSKKLEGDDRTAFDQLVYALVRTEQTYCARMLDEELTEQYLHEQGSKHGQQN